MAKILFYSIYNTCEPVFAIEMEVMAKHIENGDDVYVLRCHDGELNYCDLNPEHRSDICMKCDRSFYQNIKLINLDPKKILRIPKIDISYKKIPKFFSNIEELQSFFLEGINFGLCTASTIISEYKDHKIDTKKHQEKIYRLLKTSYFSYKFMEKVFADLNPDVFYHQGGRVANIYPLYKLADKLNIKRYSITDAGVMTKYDLFEGFTFFDFDKIAQNIEKVWNDDSSDEDKIEKASKWFVDKRNGLDVEWMSYTKDQQKNLLPDNFNEEKNNIAIFNSSINEYCSVENTQNTLYEDETDALRNIFEHYKDDDNIHFYLRIHPNLKNLDNTQIKELREISKRGYKNVSIIWPEEKIDSYALLLSCNKIVTFFSTVGVEACFWGKPSILAGRAFYEKLDCCYVPKNHGELMSLIAKDILPKNKNEAIKYGYWQMKRGYDYQKYDPSSHFGGLFLKQSMAVKFSSVDKIFLKIRKRKSKIINKVKKFLSKFNILF